MGKECYTLGCVRYCFPFDIERFAYTEGRKKDVALLGVLEPWAGREMSESEADEFLCEMIRRKPAIDGAMSVSVSVMRHHENMVSFYQTLVFRTDAKEKGEHKPIPIKWSKN